MPTHPETYEGNATSEDGSTQVRYWSLCAVGGLANPPAIPLDSACLFDQEVPTNANDEYTIVVSLPGDRPKNATPGCGVAWLNWGTNGDSLEGAYASYRRPTLDALLMRNQLSNPSFANSIEKVTTPGSEKEVMGSYYPSGSYMTKQEFEAGQNCGFATPGVPKLNPGSSTPNRGAFALEWTPSAAASNEQDVTYTLQQKDHNGSWATVASGLSSPEYTFSAGSPEAEGTWSYRVLASTEGGESEYSAGSSEVKVDRSGPNAPLVSASRPADYAGGGGWYLNSVEVGFAEDGDVALPDGSEGSGVNLASLASPVTFSTSGSHTACGTVADVLGNLSTPGCLTVQVDATPPSVNVSCPAMVAIGSSASATVTASDAYSGLKSNPSGTVPINTSKGGTVTTTATAESNVGLTASSSCSTVVGYYVVVSGPVQSINVRSGEAVELTAGATVAKNVSVAAGGALEIEGATIDGALSSKGAALLRVCGAHIGSTLSAITSTGPVVVGNGGDCAANSITKTATLRQNTGGVSLVGNTIKAGVAVNENTGGSTVTHNTITGTLSVLGNTQPTVDTPNTVSGKSKLQ